MTNLDQRHDFVLFFDVKNGNPNGDPDAGNMPRLDPETNHGLVSDVSLKRKIRNYMEIAHSEEPGRRIYVREGSILNEQHREAYKAIRPDEKTDTPKLNPKSDAEAEKLRLWMCDNFFDVRTFGAVMSTGVNCGQVRGPVQMTFAQSAEPIVPQEISITRMAATTPGEKKNREEGAADGGDERTDNRTMGRKHIVPYALYRAHGFVSAKLAGRTHFSAEDLELLFEAIAAMFEHDRSAARGEMAARRLIVFRHASALGNAPAHTLFDRVSVRRMIEGDSHAIDSRIDNYPPARAFKDYDIQVDGNGLPEGVELVERL